ncbi:hypothetical protein [Streptomyces lancefieldiae]|uniref:Uncharacterized protein n=1 Tax=Streptomyces lancefieldiae TaxID=3075520 RepID=A0ABU3AFA4_9ACTN|nr:hypothetical protein [Streptomyces sp. DSM 40712]MDT0608856.1 hypothetical protein [Streptomyces sp. DSM 40712]
MASLAGRHLPARGQAAVADAAEAARLYAACRGPQYAEARQLLEIRLRRANRVLAARNPGLTVRWADIPTLITKEER